jgi:acetoin utilization deacetylase AcuC-like enzyme
MSKTGIIQDDLFLQHDAGPFHPERKERLISIHEGLRSYSRANQLLRLKPRLATEGELRLIHSPAHIRRIQQTFGKDATELDPDTVASSRSYEVARYAAGALLQLIDALFGGEIRNAFGFVRPPGHHAEPDRAMGFCLFSNIAIGAAYALQQYKLSRVMVIDFDVHHGNGTQKAFYQRKDVLFVSTHQFPLYPGTGDFPEIGEGEGRGFTVNFPLPRGGDDALYNRLFDQIIQPIGHAYRPDLILVSAGYDAYVDDPLAGMELTPEGFAGISQSIVALGTEVCGGKVIFLLEGGYHLKGLQRSVLRSLDVLTGLVENSHQSEPPPGFASILDKSRQVFGPYWKF